MPRAPLITVLLPVYNGEFFLREALASMQNQTEGDFELLLLDDGSTDGSLQVARALGDPRIRIAGSAVNKGLAARLNEGLDAARGSFVARMDADDISHPDRLRVQSRFLQSRPQIGMCGTWYRTFGQGRENGAVRLPEDHPRIAARTLFDSPFGHPTMMFDLRQLNRRQLRYPLTAPYAEDFAFWARAHREVQMANIPEFLLDYRLHENSVCRRHAAVQESSAKFVREYGLILNGIRFSPAELRLHHRICSGQPLADREDMDRASAWLKRLGRSAGLFGKHARGMRRECRARAAGLRIQSQAAPASKIKSTRLKKSASAKLLQAQLATLHGPMDAWLRQTPGQDGLWETTWFQPHFEDEADWLITCDEPPHDFKTTVPRERRILFLGEPLVYKRYPPEYLNQFGCVVGPMALPGYRGIAVRQHSALPWHYGRACPKTWAELAADKPKRRELSVICSEKNLLPQHGARLEFLDALERRFGARLARYGAGRHGIQDKAEGLDEFRYHVVLENNLDPGFWTEKLGDCYLAHSFPIYAGGRIPEGDFDPKARMEIDLARPSEALDAIERLLDSTVFEDSQALLREQRRRVMYEHNLFAVAHRIMNGVPLAPHPLAREESIRPTADFVQPQSQR